MVDKSENFPWTILLPILFSFLLHIKIILVVNSNLFVILDQITKISSEREIGTEKCSEENWHHRYFQ